MTSHLSEVATMSGSSYIHHAVIAATFEHFQNKSIDEIRVKGYFNNEAFHSPPLVVNTVTNTILR